MTPPVLEDTSYSYDMVLCLYLCRQPIRYVDVGAMSGRVLGQTVKALRRANGRRTAAPATGCSYSRRRRSAPSPDSVTAAAARWRTSRITQ